MSDLIRFRSLVKSDNSFNPCPNCGKTAINQARYGWDGFVLFDPECKNCKSRFVVQKSRWLRRRMFAVMSPKEHEQMIDKRLGMNTT